MIKNTSYQDNGEWFDTYKFRVGNEVKILIKKDNKPVKVVRFKALSGKVLTPTEL